LMSSALH